MIDVLCPVLGRPANAQPLADSLAATATVPYMLLFLTSPGDGAEFDACIATGANVLQVEADRAQYGTKINVGYRVGRNPFVFLAADDIEFQPGWDKKALEVAERTKVGVVGLDDMANPHVKRGLFSTHPLVRRSYIREQGGSLDGPGVVYHEGYDHNFVDRELCALAMSRNQWAFAADAKVWHKHPGFRSADSDQTYQKGAVNFEADHLLFMQRAKQWGNVGLTNYEKNALRRLERGARQQAQAERRRVPPRPR